MSINYFRSEKAEIKSKFVSPLSCVLGKSVIGEKTIIDQSVIIGYPLRSKIKKIHEINDDSPSLEVLYDQKSDGSTIGERNHIRAFTTIYENTVLEDQVETGTNVTIRENTSIGLGSIIGSGTVIDGEVTIGRNARIQSSNFIPPKISIGNNVFLGPAVRFANDLYPVSSRLTPIIVKDNVIIGISAVILPGIAIGERAVIAAGALVTRDVPDDIVVAGSPAKQIMTRRDYDEKKLKYEN
jgi:acetyltransferase-like isoleucine patch superfamily enzyme